MINGSLPEYKQNTSRNVTLANQTADRQCNKMKLKQGCCLPGF